MIGFIVNVKLDSLVYLGKILIFCKKLFSYSYIIAVIPFLSAVLLFFLWSNYWKARQHNLNKKENNS